MRSVSCLYSVGFLMRLACKICLQTHNRLDLDSDDAPLVDLFARAKILNDKHGAKIEGVPAS